MLSSSLSKLRRNEMKDGSWGVLTVKEVAEILRTSGDDVVKELEEGRMQGFKIGGEWRVTEKQLQSFINGGKKYEELGYETMNIRKGFSTNWKRADPFSYKWPSRAGANTIPEEYPEVYETEIELPSGRQRAKIGYTTREAAGKEDRKRITVFITVGNQFVPAVEFVGANDFNSTHQVASIIKTAKGRQIHSVAQLPDQYKSMPVAVYFDIVNGPHASHGLAVVCKYDDRDMMLCHALIRANYKKWFER
jgi:excisionase family DNA binding protein